MFYLSNIFCFLFVWLVGWLLLLLFYFLLYFLFSYSNVGLIHNFDKRLYRHYNASHFHFLIYLYLFIFILFLLFTAHFICLLLLWLYSFFRHFKCIVLFWQRFLYNIICFSLKRYFTIFQVIGLLHTWKKNEVLMLQCLQNAYLTFKHIGHC